MEKIIRNDAGEIVAQVDGDNETFYTEDELKAAGIIDSEEESSVDEHAVRKRRAQVSSGGVARRATFGEKMGEWEREKEGREEKRWEERLGSED